MPLSILEFGSYFLEIPVFKTEHKHSRHWVFPVTLAGVGGATVDVPDGTQMVCMFPDAAAAI